MSLRKHLNGFVRLLQKGSFEAVDNVSLNKAEVSNRNVIAVRKALAQNSRHPAPVVLSRPSVLC